MDLSINENDEMTLSQFNQVVPNSSNQTQMMNINSLIDPVTIQTDDAKSEFSSFKNVKPAKIWHWNTFKPSLKKNLNLHHWQSEDEASTINYLSSSSFSKYLIYDQAIQEIPSYTPEEYELYLKNESWSKQETDYLIDSVRNYQCNFVIVHDRYAFVSNNNNHANTPCDTTNDHSLPNTKDTVAKDVMSAENVHPSHDNADTIIKKRSIEEIKMRYNELCKKLPKYRHLYDPKYDPDKDLERKNLILSILHREEQSVKEEKNILFQIDSLIDNYDKFIYERERIIANFAGDLYAFIDGIAQSDHPPTSAAASKKKTTSKGGRGGQTLITTSRSDIPSFPLSQSVISSRKADQSIYRVGTSPETSTSQLGPLGSPLKSSFGPKKEKTVIGPHLRSTRLRPVRTGLTKHVEKVMTEFGLGHKPTIPSADIVKQYDEIRSLIMNLIDMRKAADRAEQDYRTPTGVSSFHRKGGTMSSVGAGHTDTNRITTMDSSSSGISGSSFKIKTSLGGSQSASSRVSSPKTSLDTKLLNSIGSKDGISSPLNQSAEKKGIGHWKRKLSTSIRESPNKQIETLPSGGSQNSNFNGNGSSSSSSTLWDPTSVATPIKTNTSHTLQFIDSPNTASSLKRRKKQ